MKYKNKVVIISSLSALIGLISLSLTFAWFEEKAVMPAYNITGSSAGAYFAYGNGKARDGSNKNQPFGISTPRHLYNLAWLQYNGSFDNRQYYFELANDIDMSGWELPPIGTEESPFLGNFDGKGYVISNLTVSNKSAFNLKPAQVDYDTQPEIVGFFGVVGKLDNTTTSYVYDSSINSLSNITLNNLTVESKTSQTLIGLAAGYVNAEMSGVKIDGNATLDVNGQTSTAISSITSNLSDYGLVGYSTKTGSGGTYQQKLSEYFDNSEGDGSGDIDEWGGSVNPRNYSRLIYDSYKRPGTGGLAEGTSAMSDKIGTLNTITTDDYNLTFSTTVRTTAYASGYTRYSDPDCFNDPPDGARPLNSNNSIVYHIKDSCYLPLKFNEDNTGTASDNTGYLVGASSGDIGVVKVASYYPSSIVNSMSDTVTTTTNNAIADKTTTYEDSKLEVLTYSMNDNSWYRISDSHNANRPGGPSTNARLSSFGRKSVGDLGFEKYNDSRDNLQHILESGSRVPGIHFDAKEINVSDKLSVARNIKISGTTYNSAYELPKGSIDFNLKKTGYINFFAGTYYTSDMYNYTFFTLNHVNRTGGTINSIKKIAEIYQNKYWSTSMASNATTNPKYFYKYSDGTFSNIVVNGNNRTATLDDRNTSVGSDGMVFNTKAILEGTLGRDGDILRQEVNNLVFYFEVPVNDGEYAMGLPPTPTGITSYTGAYMMYLDIGANGDTIDIDNVRAYSITTVQTGNSFPSGVDFIPVSVSGNGGDSIGVYIASGSKGVLVFNVTSSNIAITDNSSISTYAFQGNKYSASDPPSGNFTVSGDPPGAMVVPSNGGTRILTIHLTTVAEDEYSIRITDIILDGSGSYNESESIYELDSGSGYVTSTSAAIQALSEEINLSDLRALAIAATLTRSSGLGEFVTTYDEENCSYEDKIIDVDIETNGTTISIGVTTDYYFNIGGVSYTNGSTYPS